MEWKRYSYLRELYLQGTTEILVEGDCAVEERYGENLSFQTEGGLTNKKSSKWATYPWTIEAGIDLIHPVDLEAFKQVANSSKVYEVMDESEYITLVYQNNCYRVRKKLLKYVPAPKYSFGESVVIKKNLEDAVITDIMWHYDKQEHFYFVSINNRKKSKRYFETELNKE